MADKSNNDNGLSKKLRRDVATANYEKRVKRERNAKLNSAVSKTSNLFTGGRIFIIIFGILLLSAIVASLTGSTNKSFTSFIDYLQRAPSLDYEWIKALDVAPKFIDVGSWHWSLRWIGEMANFFISIANNLFEFLSPITKVLFFICTALVNVVSFLSFGLSFIFI